MLEDIAVDVLSVYGITVLLTTAHIFWWWRKIVRAVIRIEYDVASCRLCVGVWVALFWCLYWHGFDPTLFLSSVGGSYFLATQER